MQQHQVYVQQCGQFGGRLGRQFSLQGLQLAGNTVTCVAQPKDFVLDPVGGDEVVLDVDAAGRHEHRATDRHTTRDRQAEDLDSHAANVAHPHDGGMTVRTSAVLPGPTRLRRTCPG